MFQKTLQMRVEETNLIDKMADIANVMNIELFVRALKTTATVRIQMRQRKIQLTLKRTLPKVAPKQKLSRLSVASPS